jgi:glutaredoxin-related protein
MSNEKLTLVSPAVVSAVVAACGAEDQANAKWVSAASKLYQCGVRFADLDDTKSPEYVGIRSMVVQAQKPNIVTLLQSSSTIGFTDQERADRRYYANRVDNVHMKRVREHLKRFEESADRGTADKKSMGERMAAKCQEMIDRIKKADEEKIDFDAVDATALLKELKACFLK